MAREITEKDMHRDLHKQKYFSKLNLIRESSVELKYFFYLCLLLSFHQVLTTFLGLSDQIKIINFYFEY